MLSTAKHLGFFQRFSASTKIDASPSISLTVSPHVTIIPKLFLSITRAKKPLEL